MGWTIIDSDAAHRTGVGTAQKETFVNDNDNTIGSQPPKIPNYTWVTNYGPVFENYVELTSAETVIPVVIAFCKRFYKVAVRPEDIKIEVWTDNGNCWAAYVKEDKIRQANTKEDEG